MRVLTIEEQTALVAAARNDRYGIPIILALYTGMRVGEVIALKDEELQPEGDSPVIHVRSGMKREYKDGISSGSGECFGNRDENKTVLVRSSPKTYTSIRDIPLIPEAVEILKLQLEYVAEDKERAGMAFTDYGFVFFNPLGQPIDQRTYADNFERIVKATGVEKTIQLGTNDASVGFHTLRHTFATRASRTVWIYLYWQRYLAMLRQVQHLTNMGMSLQIIFVQAWKRYALRTENRPIRSNESV